MASLATILSYRPVLFFLRKLGSHVAFSFCAAWGTHCCCILSYRAGHIQKKVVGRAAVSPINVSLIVFSLTVFTAWRLKKLRYLWIAVFWIGEKVIAYSLLVDPHGRNLVDVMPTGLLFFGFVYCYFWSNRQKALILLLFIIAVTTN